MWYKCGINKYIQDSQASDGYVNMAESGKSLENHPLNICWILAESWDIMTGNPATGESNYDVRTFYCLDLLIFYVFFFYVLITIILELLASPS